MKEQRIIMVPAASRENEFKNLTYRRNLRFDGLEFQIRTDDVGAAVGWRMVQGQGSCDQKQASGKGCFTPSNIRCGSSQVTQTII
jgi:hypothetical protein